MAELYGDKHKKTGEWTDGLIGSLVRRACDDHVSPYKWIHFDGPCDASWIENMNTVLDDNRTLCLTNGERIKLTPNITLIFESDLLVGTSPATVSRCGMLYLDAQVLGWEPLIDSWYVFASKNLPSSPQQTTTLADELSERLKKHTKDTLTFLHESACQERIPTSAPQLVACCLNLLNALLLQKPERSGLDPNSLDSFAFGHLVNMYYCFAFVWSFGSNLTDESRVKFSTWVRDMLGSTVMIPPGLCFFPRFLNLIVILSSFVLFF